MVEYYNVLTDYGNYALKTGSLFFCMLIFYTIILVIVISNISEGKYLKYCKYIFIIYPIFLLISFLLYAEGKKNWDKIFNDKKYEIVEGYVENYYREDDGIKRSESFSINNINFSYSRAYFNGYFNKTNTKIKEGLYLRIYYRVIRIENKGLGDNGIISIWIEE